MANDILDNRFDNLLLPDRFDCEEKARVGDRIPRAAVPEMEEAAMQQIEEDQEAECAVCLAANVVDTVLPCSHVFCRECIQPWVEQHGDCPMCRTATPPGELRPLLTPA